MDSNRGDRLGPEAWTEIAVLLLFYEVGKELREGARSMRDVSRRFAVRLREGRISADIPTSPSQISKRCHRARRYFGVHVFKVGGDANLLVSRGRGFEIRDFTDEGWRAWELTREYLLSLGFAA